MSNSCHSTIKVYGPTSMANYAKQIVGAAIGPCLEDAENPFLRSETVPPLAVVRCVSVEVPPARLVKELSSKVPDLSFTLVHCNYMGGRRGEINYEAGVATIREEEEFVVEELPYGRPGGVAGRSTENASGKDTPASTSTPVEVSSETDLRTIAGQHLEDAYACVLGCQELGRGLSWHAGRSMEEHLARYEVLKQLLGHYDVQALAGMEHRHKARVQARADLADAREKLRKATWKLEEPQVNRLLSPDERSALASVSKAFSKSRAERAACQ
jgi:hypothetical protein